MEAACCAAAAAQTAGSTPGGGGIKGGKPGTRPKGGIMGRGGALGGEGALAGAGAGAGASFFTLAFEAGFLGMVACVRGGSAARVGRREWLFDGSVNMCSRLPAGRRGGVTRRATGGEQAGAARDAGVAARGGSGL